jgi:hypothetical protein
MSSADMRPGVNRCESFQRLYGETDPHAGLGWVILKAVL